MSKPNAAAILYAALLIASIVQIFQGIILAHYFEPENQAPYRYGILVISFAYLFVSGFVESIFYFISGRYTPSARKYVGNTILYCLLVFLILILIFHLVLEPYVLVSTELNPFFREIGVYLFISFFLFFNLTAHNVLVGTEKSSAASVLRIFQSTFRLIIITTTLISGIIVSIYELILLIVLLEAFQSFLYGIVLLKKNLLSFHFRDTKIKEQYSYAFALGIAGVIPFINSSLDKIMVSTFLGAPSFVIYSISAVELPLAGIITSVFGSVFFSTYVRYADSNNYLSMANLWRKCSLHGAIINIPLGVFVFLFSDELYQLILPNTYFEGHRVLGIYALLLLLRFNSSDVLAKSLNRNVIIIQAALIILIVNILGNLFFINFLGLWGAAVATLVGIIVGWIYYIARYAKLLKTTIGHLFPWKPYIRLLTLSVIFFGGARLFFYRIEISLALILLGLAIYSFYGFSLLDRPEREYVRGYIDKIINPLRALFNQK
tara:strand:- start:35236 stop:36708 length:1473 start_codon:yes stop_codon:yes gene_type:complete